MVLLEVDAVGVSVQELEGEAASLPRRESVAGVDPLDGQLGRHQLVTLLHPV